MFHSDDFCFRKYAMKVIFDKLWQSELNFELNTAFLDTVGILSKYDCIQKKLKLSDSEWHFFCSMPNAYSEKILVSVKNFYRERQKLPHTFKISQRYPNSQ